MELDKTFINEVRKAANGDNEKNYKFDLAKELYQISADRSQPNAFNDCIKKYGRAKVALCVATTIYKNQYRFEPLHIAWASEIMRLWTNRAGERSISAAIVNIHPIILADISYSLRKLTSIATTS